MTDRFTNINDICLQTLERDLAYLYDVENPDAVLIHYMKALTEFEINQDENKKNRVVEHLIEAYSSVKKQNNWSFDILLASEYEYSLILAQAEKQSTSQIASIMEKLYQTVFSSNCISIKVIAQLRTFLYQYKIQCLLTYQKIPIPDIKIMKLLDQRSKQLLLKLSKILHSKTLSPTK